MAPRATGKNWRDRFHLVSTLDGLAPAKFVIESVKEDLELKRQIYDEVEGAVAPDAVIASNTSSLPISVLQKGRRHPDRFIGMHWGEPAQIMRYLEIIPGEPDLARRPRTHAAVGRDLRQGADAPESGHPRVHLQPHDVRDAARGVLPGGIGDRRHRDRGPVVPQRHRILGHHRRSVPMDGPDRYPRLCRRHGGTASQAVQYAQGARRSCWIWWPRAARIGNAKGFYPIPRPARSRWEKAWVEFTYEIRKLADKYDGRKI